MGAWTLNITNDGMNAAIGNNKSSKIEIFNIKTKNYMQTIESHKNNTVSCYFIDDKKAVSIADNELFFWNVSNF